MQGERINWPLLALFLALPVGHLLTAGPRPCEVSASPPVRADAPAPKAGIRLVGASQVFAGHVVLTTSQAVGVVVERGTPPADSLDQTGTVRVLVLDAGGGGNEAGSVMVLGGLELVADLGPLRIGHPVPGP